MLAMMLLGGCAAGTMTGAGQGGQSADGRSYEAARADNMIAAAVNRVLVRDRDVSASDINVSVRDGVVTLTGEVTDAATAARVVQAVRDTEGVRGVINQLRVGR
jgi:osmotically-inducible protein OsmY